MYRCRLASVVLVNELLQNALRTMKAEDTNGWAEISKTLHGIDDERIERCKDDLDSLLVFVGTLLAHCICEAKP